MASNQCIIDDEYCTAMGEYFQKQGDELDKMVSEYIAALKSTREKAIISGDVAVALDSFITYAEKMRDQLGLISDNAKTQVSTFLSKVDDADQYLF